MKYDPRRPFDKAQDRHHRRSIRLPDYDYSQPGSYFITIVTHGRGYLFGKIHDGQMSHNDAGRIVCDVWISLPGRYPQITKRTASACPIISMEL